MSDLYGFRVGAFLIFYLSFLKIFMSLFCMCRLGHMVAVFKYSTVTTYSVSLPPEKLAFSSSVNEEFLKKDFEDVCFFPSMTAFYTTMAFNTWLNIVVTFPIAIFYID